MARPFLVFIQFEAASGFVLIAATVVALAWANSPWSEGYRRVWEIEFTLGAGSLALRESLAHWINDGLMAVFFLLVGLEIKRELFVGQLAGVRKAALPVAAALGGMIVPALIYAGLNAGGEPARRGWGVPMATDIAFSLGLLSLLGQRRVPASLKVFLTALAIADDLGAFAALLLANRLGIRHLALYLCLGAALWAAMLHSGVHATVAGVLTAFAVPLRPRATREKVRAGANGPDGSRNVRTRVTRQRVEGVSRPPLAPLQHLEHALHPWVSFGIMPLFALANAGLSHPHGLRAIGESRLGGATRRGHLAPAARGGSPGRHRLYHVAVHCQPGLSRPAGTGRASQSGHPDGVVRCGVSGVGPRRVGL